MTKKIVYILALLLAGVAQANAATIDFDNDLPTYFGTTQWQQAGFTLTSNVPDGTLVDNNNLVRGALGVFSGGNNTQSIFWGENDTTSTLTLTADTAPLFNVLSLDASSVLNATGVLTLTGTLLGGGTVVQNINLTSDLTTYAAIGMLGLVSLDISFDGSSHISPFDLDNIVVAAVPVPAAVWLFGSGLFALAALRRKPIV